ncbi:MAG: LLM class flavin-dependent oxidoreductase [Xanthobacteraceae bacterium]|nr:LLM class flavin-dependent oxidoreductase [Xanthobacteraceae bacterium]
MTLGLLMAGHSDPFVHADLASFAEELGFTDVWMADERFYREVYSLLTVIAMRTKRINIGPCVTDPFSRHPALTAMAIYTLDDISKGRAILGFGAGVSGFAEMGTPRPKPVRALRESIELIRALATGEEVSYAGEVVKFDAGKLGFKPGRARLPVWLAGNGPQVQQLGAKIADAIIMEACGSALEARSFAARVRESATAAGRKPEEVHLVARLNVSLSDNAADAYDALRLRSARTLASGRTHFDTLETQGLAVPAPVREKVAHVAYKEGAPPYEAIRADISNEMIEAISLVGTPAQIKKQLAALFEAGIGGVILSALPAKGVTVQQTLERFVRECWQPALQQAKG